MKPQFKLIPLLIVAIVSLVAWFVATNSWQKSSQQQRATPTWVESNSNLNHHGIQVSYYSDSNQNKLLFVKTESTGDLTFDFSQWAMLRTKNASPIATQQPENIRSSLVQTTLRITHRGKYSINISPPGCFDVQVYLDNHLINNLTPSSNLFWLTLSPEHSYDLKLLIKVPEANYDDIAQELINSCFKELKIYWKQDSDKLRILPNDVVFMPS